MTGSLVTYNGPAARDGGSEGSGGISNLKNFGKAAQMGIGAGIDASESAGKQIVSGDDMSNIPAVISQVISDGVMGGIGGQAKVFDNE